MRTPPSSTSARLLRKALLAYARRLPPARMQARSQAGALRAVVHAARHSKAYRTLLLEAGLNPARIDANTALSQLPVLNKDNTFGRFGLAELARPVATRQLADVLTSSGRGGAAFGFRLSTRSQHERAWFDIDLGLQDVFGVDQQPTLLVNCLPMGVVFPSRAVAVANVSVREDMACAVLRDVGPRFAQTLLCTDPLFIRRLLTQGQHTGVDWAALNTSVILGEEMLVEAQRDYIAARMGIALDGSSHRLVGSSFGVGELGLNLLFETRQTIQLRRALRQPEHAQAWWGLPSGDRAWPSVFCHNPLRCHIEVLQPDAQGWGELCFTLLDRQAVIPLPRYTTGDLGRLVPASRLNSLCQQTGLSAPWLPVVEVRGRLRDRRPGVPSVEQVKQWIYQDHRVADALSGAFRVETPDQGPVRLTLQTAQTAQSAQATQAASSAADADAGPAAAVNAASICTAIARIAAADGFHHSLSVTVCTPQQDGWGPALDHERKFAYAGWG